MPSGSSCPDRIRRSSPRQRLRVAAALILILGTSPLAALPQEPSVDVLEAPVAGRWDLVRSIGQPPRWKPFVSVGYGVDRVNRPATMGLATSGGVYRHVGNPVTGLLAVGAEGYIGQRGSKLDGGLKAQVTSSPFLLSAGVDWNARMRRSDLVFGTTLPLRRGGWPTPGSELRAEWIPARKHSAALSFILPLGQPLAGQTRPRATDVPLPRAPRGIGDAVVPERGEVRAALRDARVHMTQLVSILTFFWLIEERNLRYASSVREWREILGDFAAEFFSAAPNFTGQSQYHREANAYHAALDRAFGHASGAEDAALAGRVLADAARRTALIEIVLPYNRLIGQYRTPNSLGGLAARARARYAAWLTLHGDLDAQNATEVLAVLDAWLLDLERLRARIGQIEADARLSWLPLGLVLRPEDHRTQTQIDEIIALAMERPFAGGNTAVTIDAPQFQHELRRTIRETRAYHVLWIHDYRGRDDAGNPDRTGFETTMTYLRALRDAVMDFDHTGTFPSYLIVLDQFFYETNDGRLWLTLLERPLSHRLRLGAQFTSMENDVRAMQDSLRMAVRGSRRMQSLVAALGRDWVAGVVKVHVNIVNPSDFSFRSRRILTLPVGADNWLRDHRKLILRDADESDPALGELILSGVGVGDHYASATWDDRAMIIRGPVASATRPYLRTTLERHRLAGSAMPAAVRAQPAAPAWAERVAALERSGATARLLQAHNEVGWGAKEATFIQMLLYDLAPAGTLLFVPDGLWSSYQWTAQLVGAALRGCHVYVIAPAERNAPANDFPWMSLMQELITRLTLVEEVLGAAIRAGGGDLRIGLFARASPLDDHASSLEHVTRSWATHHFLSDVVPLSAEALAVIAREGERRSAGHDTRRGIDDVHPRNPLLHRKTQWVFGAEALRPIAASPDLPLVLDRILGVSRDHGAATPANSSSSDEERQFNARQLIALHSGIPVSASESPLYFMTGSINKNVRSMTLDGEVLGVVAGPWALESFIDFVILAASTTWVESLSDVEKHLPPYSTLRKLLGRRLHRIL